MAAVLVMLVGMVRHAKPVPPVIMVPHARAHVVMVPPMMGTVKFATTEIPRPETIAVRIVKP